LNNLATVLSKQGRYQEAEKIYRQVLDAREKQHGPEHLDTLRSLSNLAYVLSSQGRYQEVEKILRQALERLHTLNSLNNLAYVLSSQGKYQEAEKIHRRVLEAREKQLGPEHPSTLSSANHLAALLAKQGRCQEAEKIHRQVLSGQGKQPGPKHQNTFSSLLEAGKGDNPAVEKTLPATAPLVVKLDTNGVQWITFESSRDRVKKEFTTIRCDVELVNLDDLSVKFKTENCVYPRAWSSRDRTRDQHSGTRLVYETECNTLGWALAKLNVFLRGKRDLIQQAVDSWRESNQNHRIRTWLAERDRPLNSIEMEDSAWTWIDYDRYRRYLDLPHTKDSISSSDYGPCGVCRKTFSSLRNLMRHSLTVHPRECERDNITWETLRWGRLPPETEGGPVMYERQFPPCTYKSKRIDNLQVHMRKAHGWTAQSTSGTMKLEPAKESSSSSSETRTPGRPTETETETEGGPVMYQCQFPPCRHKSTRIDNIKRHMRNAHGWTAESAMRTMKLEPSKESSSSEIHTSGRLTETETETEGGPVMYKCQFPPCTHQSKRIDNIKVHMGKVHGWIAQSAMRTMKLEPESSSSSEIYILGRPTEMETEPEGDQQQCQR
ncbi:MAG: hypothetical protein M1816_007652, partial [Peltula sp. TS41687]